MIDQADELELEARAPYAPELGVTLAGAAIDPELVVADLTIRSGRSRADDGINPATCTIELLSVVPAGLGLGIGDEAIVTVDGRPRFTGKIAELSRAAGSNDVPIWTVVAAGGLARMGRILVALPLPAGSAAARASSILSAAGYTADVRGGAGIELAAHGSAGDAPVSLSSVLTDLMTWTGCVIADMPDGSILVQFLDSRLSEDVWTPDPAQTYVDVEWVQSDDLVNDCTVAWTAGAVEATNPASITRYDPHTLRLDTELADAGSATARVSSIVARLATPVWECGGVQTSDPGILEHDIGCVVTLSPLPASAPVASSWAGVLEGWTDHYTPAADGSGEMTCLWELALSDRQHSAETLPWRDVDPTTRWADVDPGCSWGEAVSNGDLVPLSGRETAAAA